MLKKLCTVSSWIWWLTEKSARAFVRLSREKMEGSRSRIEGTVEKTRLYILLRNSEGSSKNRNNFEVTVPLGGFAILSSSEAYGVG